MGRPSGDSHSIIGPRLYAIPMSTHTMGSSRDNDNSQERLYHATQRWSGLDCRNAPLAGVVAYRYGCPRAVSVGVAVWPLSYGLGAAPQKYCCGVLCPAVPCPQRVASEALAQAA